jgi:ADP-heptose:LPS heptosyltransferase
LLKKILLIRFSSIGDIVLVSPVIRALKTQTGCELHVLSKQAYSNLYRKNPHVDVVHSFSRELAEVIPRLRQENFDFVVDLQKNLRSARIKQSLKKPSASFPKLNIEKWLLVNFKINRLPNQHIVDRYFQAVESLGVTNDGKGLDYFIARKDYVDLNNFPPLKENAFVGFVIGGQHKTKIFPEEKVAAVIKRLPWPVVLLGGPDDRKAGEKIKALCARQDVLNACGQLSLDQSASLVRQSGLIITNDTGLMHMAAAFNKPIISIWGNTIPEFGMFPYEPENPQRVVIAEVKGLKCRPCSKIGFSKCPKGHFKCMLLQDEDFIVHEALRLFPKTAGLGSA